MTTTISNVEYTSYIISRKHTLEIRVKITQPDGDFRFEFFSYGVGPVTAMSENEMHDYVVRQLTK